jgi:hypothetical protein
MDGLKSTCLSRAGLLPNEEAHRALRARERERERRQRADQHPPSDGCVADHSLEQPDCEADHGATDSRGDPRQRPDAKALHRGGYSGDDSSEREVDHRLSRLQAVETPQQGEANGDDEEFGKPNPAEFNV